MLITVANLSNKVIFENSLKIIKASQSKYCISLLLLEILKFLIHYLTNE